VIHKRGAISRVYWLYLGSDIQNFGCIEYVCCWNSPMRYTMQEYSPIWRTDFLIWHYR